MSDQERPGYWAVVPAPVRYDTAIPASAKLLYAELSSLTNERGYCFASNAYFAANFSMTDTSVRRLLKALADRGFIRIDVLRDKKTNQVKERKIYVGLNPAASAPPSAQNCAESAQKSAEGSAQNCSDLIMYNNKNNNNNPPISPQGEERADYFEIFWSRYPKKRNKTAARRAWNKLKPDEQLCRVMDEALRVQMRSEEWQRDGGRYIPYPASWINGRRWEDEEPLSPQATAPSKAPSKRWVGTKIVDGEEVDVYE